jgi:hypothetical protein
MTKPGRNDLCDCGSGKKFKRCHGVKSEGSGRTSTVLMVVVGGAVLAALAAGVASFTAGGSSGTRIWDPVHGHYHDANGVQVP